MAISILSVNNKGEYGRSYPKMGAALLCHMNPRAIITLEFDKIRTMAAAHISSEMGREVMETLLPATSVQEAENLLKQTLEAESVYRRTGRTPVDAFPDIRATLRKVPAVYSLSMGELLQVNRCLKVSRQARDVLLAGDGEGLLKVFANKLASQEYIENEISRCILSEDEMADNASPELSRIRRQMKLTTEKVRDKLNSILRSSTYQKYLQDPIITVRNGRYAIPVKAEYRTQIPGLIHDQSSSGQTLFIEPTAVVDLGNEYRKLQLDEKKEMDRILAGLTSLIAPEAESLYDSLHILARLDCIFARAMLARDMDAVCPKLNDKGYIKLLNARHPLIDPKKVVPVTMWLGDDFDTLIITGPNTGGKTVTLKTVGLFTLMAMSGMFIPADMGSEIGFFEEVFADIGDEQSIEQSLSTFSAHMTNLVSILAQADKDALVLVDELGAGTDPLEGAALAQAILEYLQQRGARTMATTHYSEIKAFALSRDRMQNASMEFDVDRLCPTYKLYIGIPGKSNAFEISQRLGLRTEIIDRARVFLKKEDVAFEDVLSGAEKQRKLAEEDRRQTQLALLEAERLKREAEDEKQKLQKEKSLLKQKAREDAREVVRKTRSDMEQLIANLRNIQNIDSRALERAIQESRDTMRHTEENLYENIEHQEEYGSAPNCIRVGESYYVTSIHGPATVIKGKDSKGQVQIQSGIMKMHVPATDLRILQKMPEKKVRKVTGPILTDVQEVKLDLDLRGYLVDDAVMEIDRYIDMCLMHGRKEFNIIHGKGTGALRTGVQAYLKGDKRVKTFRLGNYGEGDAGVTVVTLK